MVRKPVCSRALAIPRSARSTTIGSKVDDVVSAKVSATPSRKIATRTIHTCTCPVRIVALRMARITARVRSTPMTMRRRS